MKPVKTDLELLALYGPCPVCGAPRQMHRFSEGPFENGQINHYGRILCSVHPVAHYSPDKDLRGG